MTGLRIVKAARPRLAALLMVLAGSMAVSGCTIATFISDALLNPPLVETIRSPSGAPIELFKLEVGEGPKRALYFVSGSGCASLSYYTSRRM